MPPEHVANNHEFRSITELWLDGDHYKWRAMRTNGVAERLCTGDATDFEKFQAWACTVPRALRCPLLPWTQLELINPVGIGHLRNEASAREIFGACNAALKKPGFYARGLLEHFSVAVVCTTDDPADSLEHHRAYAAEPAHWARAHVPDVPPGQGPAHRARRSLQRLGRLTRGGLGSKHPQLRRPHVRALCAPSGVPRARRSRLRSRPRHGLRRGDYSHVEASAACSARVRSGGDVNAVHDALRFKSALLHDPRRLLDHEKAQAGCSNFTSARCATNNTRLFRALGPRHPGSIQSAISTWPRPSRPTSSTAWTTATASPKPSCTTPTPRDNEALATLIGSFQDGSVPGQNAVRQRLVVPRPARRHVERQLNALSNMGLLSRFVGMLTDSRSFLSYTRHEYFRRLLCNLLGHDVRRGLIPNDRELLGDLVKDLCFPATLSTAPGLGLGLPERFKQYV